MMYEWSLTQDDDDGLLPKRDDYGGDGLGPK